MKNLIFFFLTLTFLNAQTVYELPFASQGNEIELSVLNTSGIKINNVNVEAIEKPEWISFEHNSSIISELKSNEEGLVTFLFNVDKEATVLDEQSLKFQINGNNQSWEKEIKITVLPPDKFELNQNYPNPFNPTTTISYTIPAVSYNVSMDQSVHLAIYDILGREVETLVNNDQPPGYYKIDWNANNYASGMYIYQVSIKSENSKSEFIRKKMILMK